MAQLARSFDPTQHDTEQRDYEGLPEGIYEFELESSKPSEKNTDSYYRLEGVLNVRAPEAFANRKLFVGYNLVHSTAMAQEIGNREFAALCRAIGHQGPVEDSEDLHLRPFTAKVALGKPSKEKGDNGQPKYPARPEIKRYFFPDEGNVPAPEVTAANDNTPPATQQRQAAPQQQAAAKPAGARPWGKK